MKTRIIFALFFFWGVFSVFAQSSPVTVTTVTNGFKVNFTLPSYALRDTTLDAFGTNEIFKYIKINDFGHIDDTGFPQLPQYSLDLHVPSGASNFVVSSSNLVTQSISVNRRVVPTQDDNYVLPSSPFQLDQSYYASNGSLYNYTNKLSDPYIVFGENGIALSIFPFLYNPQANTITVVKSVTFTITYTPPRGGVQTSSDSVSSVKSDYLSGFFVNYEKPRGGTQFTGRYLIITSNTPGFEAALNPFVNYKSSLGYQVTMVNTSVTGNTSTSIKNYLQTRYNNTSTRPDFVLLVGIYRLLPAAAGDTTGNSINNPLTDLPYACLHGNDLFADVMLGRFPVETPKQLQNIISKTMFMEQSISILPKKAKFVAGSHDKVFLKSYYESKFRSAHEPAIKTLNKLGYNSQKLDQPNTTQVQNALNDNPLFFVYSGHANRTVMDVAPSTINDTFLSGCSNTIFPLVFSFACLAGNYTDTARIGSQWLIQRKGGVSFFGSSVETCINSDIAIENKILGETITDRERLGEITNLGMKRYYRRFWSRLNPKRTERYMKAYNLLGDPSFNIRGSKWSYSGSTLLCLNSSATYTINHFPANMTATWNQSSHFQQVSGTGASKVFKGVSNGAGWVEATVNGVKLPRFNVLAGAPIASLKLNTSYPYNYEISNLVFEAELVYSSGYPCNLQGITQTSWSTTNSIATLNSSSLTNAWFKAALIKSPTLPAIQGDIKVKVTNTCGYIDLYQGLTVSLYPPSAPAPPNIYPNPAEDVLYVEIENTESERSQDSSLIYDIRLYDGQGNLLRQSSSKGGTVQFNLSDLPNGIYYLHTYDGVSKNPYMQQIVVEH